MTQVTSVGLVRHGINSFGGYEFYWDDTWDLGGPLGEWRWGDSVVSEHGRGERRFYNVCAGCRLGFWHPTLIRMPQPALCPRCARKTLDDATDAHAAAHTAVQSQFEAYADAEASGEEVRGMFAEVWSHLQTCIACGAAYAEFKGGTDE